MSRVANLRLCRALTTCFSLAVGVLCVPGCNNTCVSGTLNSPGGSTVNVKIASPPPSCMLSAANGIVHLEIGAAPGAASTPGAIGPHMTHLFVTLEGVEAHPSAVADDDALDWRPLALQLQAHPLQVDLLANPQVSDSFSPLPDTVLPAGVYRQIRLRFASPLPGELALETNRCGAGAPHCAVMSDGRIQPVTLSPSTLIFRDPSERVPGRELYVPPDGVVTLRIEFDQDRSWAWFSGDSLLLAPVFHLSVQQPPNAPNN